MMMHESRNEEAVDPAEQANSEDLYAAFEWLRDQALLEHEKGEDAGPAGAMLYEVGRLAGSRVSAVERERRLVEAVAASFSRLPKFQIDHVLDFLAGDDEPLEPLPSYREDVLRAISGGRE